MEQRRVDLDALALECRARPNTVMVAVDGSVPKNPHHQSSAAAVWEATGTRTPGESTIVAGKSTSDDAELFALALGIHHATAIPGATQIVVFSDSVNAICLALDPSLHSAQAQSIAACKSIREWLTSGDDRFITFIHVPSKLEWDLHHLAHRKASEMRIAVGNRPSCITLDYARKHAVERMLGEWTRLFQHPAYQGRSFLHLEKSGKRLAPSHLNGGGPWLQKMGKSNAHTARMVRAISGHAPIGAYRIRFNLSEEGWCSCTPRRFETRDHVLKFCPACTRSSNPALRSEFVSFLSFLEKNPRTFSFEDSSAHPFPKAKGRKRQKKPPDKGGASGDPAPHAPAAPRPPPRDDEEVWVPGLAQFIRYDLALQTGYYIGSAWGAEFHA